MNSLPGCGQSQTTRCQSLLPRRGRLCAVVWVKRGRAGLHPASDLPSSLPTLRPGPCPKDTGLVAVQPMTAIPRSRAATNNMDFHNFGISYDYVLRWGWRVRFFLRDCLATSL